MSAGTLQLKNVMERFSLEWRVGLLLMERNNNRGQAGRPHSAVSPHFV
jgi:hypothetical protein